MRFSGVVSVAVVAVATLQPVMAWTISELCDSTYIATTLPASPAPGVVINNSSLSTAVANYTSGTTNYTYCNVTFSYSHAGLDDTVWLQYFLPDESYFTNRYLSVGGGGEAINSGDPTTGLPYGAVTGRTDGGFGGFSSEYDVNGVDLVTNGTLNYQELFMMGYQAHHELSLVGKALTKNVYEMGNGTKLYSYYSACSEGGRQGWSQLQRFGDEWDGALVGAPAFRYAHQQVNHMFGSIVMQTLGYAPSPCETETIVNATIAACDPLDGRVDGVVSRTDLCKLQFNISSLIGTSYNCPVVAASTSAFGTSAAIPAQNGTFTEQSINVVQTFLDGMFDSNGKRVYLSWQPSASMDDLTPSTYNETTGLWQVPNPGIAGTYVGRLLFLTEETALPSIAGITYDTLRDWMSEAMLKYYDTLHTAWPDLTPFYEAGGKIIHYHGESDYSIPTASSVHYYENVAKIMYHHLSYNESHDALGDWYRLFLIPGAGHCSSNDLQPNGPFPETPLTNLIAWVEQGVKPVTLNSTVSQGPYVGDQPLCAWPLRPYWTDDETMVCQYDQTSIDTWQYDFNAFKMPIY